MPGAYPSVPSLTEALPASSPEITDATLKRMAQMVRKYSTDAGVAMAARQITQGVGERNARGTVERLQGWVRDHIRYVSDPRRVEMVQTPPQTLSILTGDCDDKVVLLAALLESMGFTTRFAAIQENHEPVFTHVMTQVRLGTRWVNLETILRDVGAGWYPTHATGWRFYHV